MAFEFFKKSLRRIYILSLLIIFNHRISLKCSLFYKSSLQDIWPENSIGVNGRVAEYLEIGIRNILGSRWLSSNWIVESLLNIPSYQTIIIQKYACSYTTARFNNGQWQVWTYFNASHCESLGKWNLSSD